MTNEATHAWIYIDDGQIVKRCNCGTIQNDDGSVTRETYDKAANRIKEAGKQQPLFVPKAAHATQLQLG